MIQLDGNYFEDGWLQVGMIDHRDKARTDRNIAALTAISHIFCNKLADLIWFDESFWSKLCKQILETIWLNYLK